MLYVDFETNQLNICWKYVIYYVYCSKNQLDNRKLY